MSLPELRDELASIDRALLELVARRLDLARLIGELKHLEARGIRDRAQEDAVIARARGEGSHLGLPPELAETIMRLLIDSSLTVQERGRAARTAAGRGRRALVIGGAGLMGGWFVRFLQLQGWQVEIADPAPAPPDPAVPHHPDWRALELDHDLVLVAAPLGVTARVLGDLAERRPPGVVCDVGSLKTPLRDGLDRLRRAGVRVTSIHPMFGPDTALLSGRHVIVVDLGVAEANRLLEELFAPTMATVVRLELSAHDRVVAFVLGLSHALNIAFFTALAESGESAPELAGLSSTTFERQLAVARRVAAENPRLYFEIQHLNQHGDLSLGALERAVTRLRSAVSRGDEAGFVTLMEAGRGFLRGLGEEAAAPAGAPIGEPSRLRRPPAS